MTDLSKFEINLGFCFNNKELLREALIHRSYLNEHRHENLNSNERLEFLGDAVLEFGVSHLLFEHFSQEPEGFLTACRSQIVQTKALAVLSSGLNIGDFLFLSKGEEESGGRKNPALLENAFEAVIGAVFMDQGIEKALSFIEESFMPIINSLSVDNLKDDKSLLQEKTQERDKITPTYKLIDDEGPDHAKIFTMGVFLGKKKLAEGKGRSRQEAEEEAAKYALEKYYKN
ncbi:MAG: ribonuclease III [bacterium]|nr:ribonuclease III [bacterium]